MTALNRLVRFLLLVALLRAFAAQAAPPNPVVVGTFGTGPDIAVWENSQWFIYYNENNKDFVTPWGSGGSYDPSAQVLSGDLFGDGRTEIFQWRKADHTWVVQSSSQQPGQFASVEWPGVAGEDGPFYVGDFEGKGRTDVIMWDNNKKLWVIYLSTGSGFNVEYWPGAWGSDGPIFVGDLNGDKRADVFMWRDSTKSWTVNISTGKGFSGQEWKGAWGSDGPIHLGDLEGNGKTDVFMWRDSTKTWTVNLSTGKGFKMAEWHGSWGSDGPNFIGSFSGTTKSDLLIQRQSDGVWFLNKSTGKDFVVTEVPGPPLTGSVAQARLFDKQTDALAIGPDPTYKGFQVLSLKRGTQTWPSPKVPTVGQLSYPSSTPYGGTAQIYYDVFPDKNCPPGIRGTLAMGKSESVVNAFNVGNYNGSVTTPPLTSDPSLATLTFSCVTYGVPDFVRASLAVGPKPIPVTPQYASLSVIFVLNGNPFGNPIPATLNVTGYRTVNGVKQTGPNDTFTFSTTGQLDTSSNPTIFGGGNLSSAAQLNLGTWTVSANITGVANPQTCTDVPLVVDEAYALTIRPGANVAAGQSVCSLGTL